MTAVPGPEADKPVERQAAVIKELENRLLTFINSAEQELRDGYTRRRNELLKKIDEKHPFPDNLKFALYSLLISGQADSKAQYFDFPDPLSIEKFLMENTKAK